MNGNKDETAKFKVYPPEYDPKTASEDPIKGETWEKEATLVICRKNQEGTWILPVGRWCEKIGAK